MDIFQILLLMILVALQIGVFIGGVFVGRFMCINTKEDYVKPQSFLKTSGQKESNNKTIQIDDKKFVTEIKTTGMEKKYDTIGKEQISDKDISSSINKLKNMKG